MDIDLSTEELRAASTACAVAMEVAKGKLGRCEVSPELILAGYTPEQLDEFIRVCQELETDFNGLILTHDCLVREDAKAHLRPLITGEEPAKEFKLDAPEMMQDVPPFVSRPPMLQKLIDLATKDGVRQPELIEVVKGLRLFPRGVEHRLSSLPEAKIEILLKNWEVVLRLVTRMRSDKEDAASVQPK
jgi:hypothetical protein